MSNPRTGTGGGLYYKDIMRVIALTLSGLSILMFSLTMVSGLKSAHLQEFYLSHIYWSFATLAVLLLTLALCLMFIFKMHGIIHDLIRQLDKN